jgi:ribosomal protein L11 methyltransferase
VCVVDVPSDWEDRWRTFHRPVAIGPLWIGPPWEEAPADATTVVIDPGRAFGTGAHPTTRLCLEWLVELERGSVLDVGCGSGVLSIAAAKLGYAPVVAVDVDAAAVEATRQNAAANGVELDVHVHDAVTALPRAGLSVANIALEVVSRTPFASELVVTSGYLERSLPAVASYARQGRKTSEEWAADLWRRPE